MHGTLDGNVDQIEAEILIFLAMFDKEGEVGSYFGLHLVNGEQLQKGKTAIGKKGFKGCIFEWIYLQEGQLFVVEEVHDFKNTQISVIIQ